MNEKWIEDFYKTLEKADKNYKRPADYKERANRVLNRQYSPMLNQAEGRSTKRSES